MALGRHLSQRSLMSSIIQPGKVLGAAPPPPLPGASQKASFKGLNEQGGHHPQTSMFTILAKVYMNYNISPT